MDPERRRLLRTAATVVTALGGGCAGTIDGESGDGPGDATPAGSLADAARRWTPAPAGLGIDGYDVTALSAAVVREQRGALPETTAGRLDGWVADRPATERFGVDRGDVGAVVGADVGATVLLGALDPATVVASATDEGFEDSGTEHGHRVLTGPSDPPRVLAVADRSLVSVRPVPAGPASPAELASAVLATAAGEANRYADVEESFDRAAGRVLGHVGVLRRRFAARRGYDPAFRRLDRWAYGWRLGANRAELRMDFAFEDVAAVDAGAVRSYVRESVGLDPYELAEPTVEGSTVSLVGNVALEAFDLLEPGPPGEDDVEPVPQAAFEFDYDAGTGRLTVVHTGGATLDRDNTGRLTVTAGGTRLATFALPVGPGDRVTVAVDAGRTVRVVWTAPDGDRSATVATFEVPA